MTKSVKRNTKRVGASFTSPPRGQSGRSCFSAIPQMTAIDPARSSQKWAFKQLGGLSVIARSASAIPPDDQSEFSFAALFIHAVKLRFSHQRCRVEGQLSSDSRNE
jgi:hypothetical protein